MKRFSTIPAALLLAAFSYVPLYAQGTAIPSKTVPTANGGVSAAAVYPLTNKQILVPAEGSYFIVRNPTPGTGIAGHAAATTLDDTKALLLIKNNATALSGINIYLDYIRLKLTNAGTAGTNVRFDMKVDYSSRYSSGATALTPTNVNSSSNAQSQAAGNVYFGAVTCSAASSNVRLLDGFEFRPVIGVVGDVYTMNYGGPDHPITALITSGTAITHQTVNFHPVVIGPGQTFLLHQWSGSQSGAYQFEVTAGYFER